MGVLEIMIYLLLADLVLIVHLLFIAFVLLGGLLLILRRALIVVHLPALIWAALSSFRGWVCPLTPLENYLREAAGMTGYQQGFIEYYLLPIIYPSNLTPHLQIMLGVLVVLVNLAIYGLVYYKTMAKRGGKRR